MRSTHLMRSWSLVVAGSIALALAFQVAQIPAAWMLGPMAAALVARGAGAVIFLPHRLTMVVQALLGTLVGCTVTAASAAAVAANVPLLVGIALLMIAGSVFLGWCVARWGGLPGSTAIWGLSPGAAAVMVVLAASFRADAGMVALMQYLRVVLVAIVAALVAHLWFGVAAAHDLGLARFTVIDLPSTFNAVLVAAIGGWIGARLRLPAGMMLMPMFAAAALQASGAVELSLPTALQACVFVLLGLQLGFGFSRTAFVSVRTSLRMILACIAAIMILCAACGWLLVRFAGTAPVTAFLATSPGGMDSVAVIAASSNADTSFVMAVQTVRFVLVLAIAPVVARILSRATPGDPR